jgi:hypothetical protein
VVDVLANRHARRAPYQLPPSPVSSTLPTAFEASTSSGSHAGPLDREVPMLTMRTGRVRHLRTKVGLPPGALAVIVDAKDHYCLTLLTVNSMLAPLTACLQAQDQLQASRLSLGMNTGVTISPGLSPKQAEDDKIAALKRRARDFMCYSWLTVLSDLDGRGVVLKSSNKEWSKCCPIKKEVQLSFENIPEDKRKQVQFKHTRGCKRNRRIATL